MREITPQNLKPNLTIEHAASAGRGDLQLSLPQNLKPNLTIEHTVSPLMSR